MGFEESGQSALAKPYTVSNSTTEKNVLRIPDRMHKPTATEYQIIESPKFSASTSKVARANKITSPIAINMNMGITSPINNDHNILLWSFPINNNCGFLPEASLLAAGFFRRLIVADARNGFSKMGWSPVFSAGLVGAVNGGGAAAAIALSFFRLLFVFPSVKPGSAMT